MTRDPFVILADLRKEAEDWGGIFESKLEPMSALLDELTVSLGIIPELLEALKAMAGFWAYSLDKPNDEEPSEADQRRAEELGEIAANAIAKAEGRS